MTGDPPASRGIHPPGPADRPAETDRLADIETALTHLQHDLSQMHAVLLAHTAELAALARRVEKFEGRLDRVEDPPEDRDPRAEKPPHY